MCWGCGLEQWCPFWSSETASSGVGVENVRDVCGGLPVRSREREREQGETPARKRRQAGGSAGSLTSLLVLQIQTSWGGGS